jgi:tetratricopeptide (TPR) repeat protein
MMKYAESRSLLEASVACYREADLPDELAISLSHLSLVLRNLDEFSAARAMLDEVVALCRQSGDQSQEGTALRRLALLHLVQNNDGEAARPLAQAALALHQATGNRSEEAASHDALAFAYEALKQLDLAEQHEWHVLEISEAAGSNSLIVGAVWVLAVYLLERDDYASALRLVEEHWRRAQHSGDDFFANQMTWPKVWVLLSLGQYQHCLEMLKAYAAFARKALGEAPYGGALGLGVFARAELGDYGGAQEALAQMWDTVTQASVPANSRAEALGWRAYLGWLENTADSLRRGLTDAAQAVALVTGAWSYPSSIIAQAHLFSARIHLLLGAPEAALAASTEALRVRVTYAYADLFNFHLTHARALRANGRKAEADETLKQAYDYVMRVADNLQDETLRRSWLENVRDNREIVAEWAARESDS